MNEIDTVEFAVTLGVYALENLCHLFVQFGLSFFLFFGVFFVSFVDEIIKLNNFLIGSNDLGVAAFAQILDSTTDSRFDFKIWIQSLSFKVKFPKSEFFSSL